MQHMSLKETSCGYIRGFTGLDSCMSHVLLQSNHLFSVKNFTNFWRMITLVATDHTNSWKCWFYWIHLCYLVFLPSATGMGMLNLPACIQVFYDVICQFAYETEISYVTSTLLLLTSQLSLLTRTHPSTGSAWIRLLQSPKLRLPPTYIL